MIASLRLYAALAALVAALAGVGYVRHLAGQNALLKAQVAEARHDADVQRQALEQARAAQARAWQEAERRAAKAREYDALRLWIEGQDDDAPTPPLLLAALDRLFGRSPR